MSPEKKAHPRNKSGKSVTVRSSDSRGPQSSLTFVEKEPCCQWCNCCQKTSETDADLRALLQEGHRQRNFTSGGKEKPTGPLKYTFCRDGCAETGYFTHLQKEGSENTMEKLRKRSKATQDLPAPSVAIEKSNNRQTLIAIKKSGKRKKTIKGETNMTEINKLLKRRLSGTISMFEDSSGEEGEALLSGTLMEKDIAPFLLSSLVNEAEVERMRSSFSEGVGGRRRSSFSRRSMDVTIENNTFRTENLQKGESLENTSDIDFINKLPTLSTLIKQELEKDLSFTQRYVRVLERLAKSDSNKKKTIKKQERWMILFYTTSEESDDLVHFSCMLVRLILQHHCVAYEERDVALYKKPYRKELQAKLEKNVLIVPYVFAKGIAIGGSRIIYAIHKMKLMKVIFKDFIMSQDLYVEWLTNTQQNKVALSIDVKLTKYPALRTLVGKATKVPLTYEENKQVIEGKEIIKLAREKWQMMSKDSFVQPNFLIFVQLRSTIMMILNTINNIYLAYTITKDRKQKTRRLCCC